MEPVPDARAVEDESLLTCPSLLRVPVSTRLRRLWSNSLRICGSAAAFMQIFPFHLCPVINLLAENQYSDGRLHETCSVFGDQPGEQRPDLPC
ncbi:hypothetical protein [Stakelama tenebrarum]|uniref:Uncharacterized protein n=1 Tax=Stakelama tenebrarum TaxID=2711215 RepID=A0A6G6Y468_9SPHN|nr:hypothetical protein [Sphingosinithalassobacter tenebrarum]QIG79641.1 hypothetical protein G5C33_07445 [Sphingosinithalassobacter tenebrarum]